MSDIVSPISDKILPTKVTPVDAFKAGRVGYEKPTAQSARCLTRSAS